MPGRSGGTTCAPRNVVSRVKARAKSVVIGKHPSLTTLAALAEQAQRFPNGQMAEERESLLIQALVSLGRVDEARARAARFERRYPMSMFRTAVEMSLRSISQRNER